MQADYDFTKEIHETANMLAEAAIRSTYEEDIETHCVLWTSMYNLFETIISECNDHMKKIGNI